MKKNYIKLLLLTTLCFLCNLSAFAWDFVVDGIYYNYGSQRGTCEVTYRYSSGDSYTGDIVIPSSVTYSGTTYSVTSIGSYAFYGCDGLKSITIPNSVTSIQGWVFGNCDSLKSVTFEDGDKALSLGRRYDGSYYYAFTGSNVQEVYLGRTLDGYEPGFGPSLTKATIGNKLDTLSLCFSGCTNLKSITIPNSVTSIGSGAFSGCMRLKTINIPNSVTSIGSSAFYGCSNLRTATIGTSVTNIGKYAFGNCRLLDKIILLPNSVPAGFSKIFYSESSSDKTTNVSIAYAANDIYDGYELGSIKIYPFLSSKFEKDGVWYVPVSPSERTCDVIDCTYSDSITNINIGKEVEYKSLKMTVKDVNSYSFINNKAIQTLTASNNGYIGNYAFRGCNQLQEVTASNDGYIGNYAFRGCDSLKTIKLNGTHPYIGQNAFASCTAMTKATLSGNISTLESNSFNGCTNLVDLSLSPTIDTIGYSAFEDCSSLKNVTFPDSLKSLGSSAFKGCSALDSVKINKKVKVIYDDTFYGCRSLKGITIPDNVNTIGEDVFTGCTRMKTFIVEDGKDTLSVGNKRYYYEDSGEPLFADCPLDSVYLGSHISYRTDQRFNYSPFYSNTSLRAIRIADNVGEVYDNEFYGCTNLTSVSIGEGVKRIGNRAFSMCTKLDNFVFGRNVESIGEEAFSDCVNMTRLVSHCALPPTCGTQALDDINKMECTLFVPQGYVGEYQTADQWKEFFFMEELENITTGVNVQTTDEGDVKEVARYTTDGQRISTPVKGINIVKMSDGTVKKVLVK